MGTGVAILRIVALEEKYCRKKKKKIRY